MRKGFLPTAFVTWHTGLLPGTATLALRTHTGFSWAAFVNTRTKFEDMLDSLEALMWHMVGSGGQVARLKRPAPAFLPQPPGPLRSLAAIGGGLAEQQPASPWRERGRSGATHARSFFVHEVVVIPRRAQGGRQGQMSPTLNRTKSNSAGSTNCDVHRHDQQPPLHRSCLPTLDDVLGRILGVGGECASEVASAP